MCDVWALISNLAKYSADYTRKALLAGENRGRASSGILRYAMGEARFRDLVTGIGASTMLFSDPGMREAYYRDIGEPVPTDRKDDLVSLIKKIEHFSAEIIIGHNRYPTSGSDVGVDTQPILLEDYDLGLAHNGQVLNILGLKEKFADTIWQSECDAEPLGVALGKSITEKKSAGWTDNIELFNKILVPALEDIINPSGKYYVNGAYSVVAYMKDVGFMAFRDAHGIRPLSMATYEGRNRKIVMFSSETAGFHILPFDVHIDEVQRGELVFVDNDVNVYRNLVHQESPAFCIFEEMYFSRNESDYGDQQVVTARRKIGERIGRVFIEHESLYDSVMAMPNTSFAAALGLCNFWNKQLYLGMEKRTQDRLFQPPSQEERESEIDEKYSFNRDEIKGKKIALVDDSTVRGTTLRKTLKRLFDLGAKYVGVYCYFDMIKHPCFYGIDTPDPEELIAARHHGDLERIKTEIAGEFGSRVSINFLPLNELEGCVAHPLEEYCTGCVTGKYPTDTSCFEKYLELRRKERAQTT